MLSIKLITKRKDKSSLLRPNLLVKYTLCFVFLLSFLIIYSAFSHKAAFASGTNACPAPAGIPCGVVGTYFYNVDQPAIPTDAPALDYWLSPEGNSPSDIVDNVTAGQTNAPIQFNAMSFLAHYYIDPANTYYPADGTPNTNGSINGIDSQMYIDSVTPIVGGSVSGCVSKTNGSAGNPCKPGAPTFGGYPGGDNYSEGHPSTRYWTWPPQVFYYIPNGGSFSCGAAPSCTIVVNFSSMFTPIEQHHPPGGGWTCVNGGGGITSFNPAANWGCTPTPRTFTLTFNVGPVIHKPIIMICTPPSVSCPGGGSGPTLGPSSCSALNFTASDPLDPSGDPVTSTSITVSPTPTGAPNPTATNTGGSGSYDYYSDISNWIGYQAETFSVTATDSAGTSSVSTFTVGPCATFTCGTLTTPTADLGGTYSLQTSINDTGPGGTGSPGPDGAPPGNVGVAPPGGGAAGNYTVNGTGGETYTVNGLSNVQSNAVSVTNSSPGVVTVTWSFSYNGVNTQSSPCSDTYTVVAQPYFRAYGGDVIAGVDSQYPSSCYDNPSGAGIYSFNNGSTTNAGAGTSEVAIATNQVNDFASGQSNNPLLGGILNPLTFSNTSSPPGDYGSGGNCGGTDYYGLSTAPTCLSNTIPGQTITAGHSVICKTTGNVTITGSILYNLAGATASTMPVFEIITQGGNITMDTGVINSSGVCTSGVCSLAGTYIAELYKGAGGTICDTNPCQVDQPGSPDNSTNTANDDRLTVDGNFIANQIDLYRSYGSINDAVTSTTPPDPTDSEEFDYSPINWLVPSASDNTPTVQAITSLPPVL